jgi:copper(I)-binding protein
MSATSLTKSCLLTAAMLVAGIAQAHSFNAGDLSIDHPYARATVGSQPNGAAYMQIENKGKTDDALLSASSPVAATVEVHSMKMEGDVMKMRAVDSLELKAGSKLEMKPGDGYHVMLLGLKKPLKAGDKFPLTLSFRKAGKVKVSVHVSDKGMDVKPAMEDDMHEHDHHHH